jgi:hypothetical protein
VENLKVWIKEFWIFWEDQMAYEVESHIGVRGAGGE